MNNYTNQAANTVRQVKEKFQGTSTFVKIILLIVLIVIIVLVIMWIVTMVKSKITFNKNNPVLVSGEIDTTSTPPGAKLPKSLEGNLYSISCWINIADYTKGYGSLKNILVRTGTMANPIQPTDSKDILGATNCQVQSPGIYLDATTTNLRVFTSVMDPNNGGKVKCPPEECVIRNIPLNKWVHIVYVLNSNNVDVYINGKLERSCVLNGIPYQNDFNSLYLLNGPSYNGKLAQVQYFTEAITPGTVLQLYNKGPSGKNSILFADASLSVDYNKLKNELCSDM